MKILHPVRHQHTSRINEHFQASELPSSAEEGWMRDQRTSRSDHTSRRRGGAGIGTDLSLSLLLTNIFLRSRPPLLAEEGFAQKVCAGKRIALLSQDGSAAR